MRRSCILGIAGTLVITGAAVAADAAMAPKLTVQNQGRKNHVVTTIGAKLTMVLGLNRAAVTPALMALDRHLQARLSAGEPALVYPEVVVSIVKAAVLRGWSGGDSAAVLVGALRKIDEGHSPEMTRQKVVLAIVRNENAPAVLARLAAEPAVAATSPD
jgi:hypothetical protein